MRVLISMLLGLIILFSCKKDKVNTPFQPFIAPDSFQTVNGCNTSEPNVIEINYLNELFAIKQSYLNFQITNDGGNTWTSKISPESGGFHSFIRTKDIFYLYNNKLFYTEDGGEHFEVLDSSTITHDLVFLSETVGIKTGIHIYRTTDGGHTWVQTYVAEGFNGAKQIQFPSNAVGYSNVSFQAGTSYGAIIKTVDGGVTWQEVLTDIGEPIYDISFINTKTGYFTTANGDLYKTSDGGNDWTLVSDFNTVNFGYNQIEFVSENQGYLWNGADTKVYLTRDSGVSWTLVANSGCDYINNVQRIGNTVVITGLYGSIMKGN